MVYADCVQLLNKDSKLKLSKYFIKEAFALCKMTVIAELEPEGQLQY